MTKERIIEIIDNYVKEKYSVEATGHDYYHIDRVKKNAILINKKENANEFVIIITCLLHDVFDHKFYNGHNTISQELENLLKELEVSNYISKSNLKNILDSCENIGYTSNKNGEKELSHEGKIVQDADRLDAIGAIGIARTFAYGGKVGNLLYDPNNIENKTTINHFYDKLLKLKDLMNTETGKKLAKKRHKYMEEFLNEFYKEWN